MGLQPDEEVVAAPHLWGGLQQPDQRARLRRTQRGSLVQRLTLVRAHGAGTGWARFTVPHGDAAALAALRGVRGMDGCMVADGGQR